MPRNIPLTQGRFTQVADDMFEFLNSFKWYYHNGYAERTVKNPDGKQITEYMHWYVIGKPLPGFVTDHVDGNRANNQLENLKIVTVRQNAQNSHTHRAGRLVGTTYFKQRQKWMARIRIDGKKKYLGLFESELAAHQAYLEALGALGAITHA